MVGCYLVVVVVMVTTTKKEEKEMLLFLFRKEGDREKGEMDLSDDELKRIYFGIKKSQ